MIFVYMGIATVMDTLIITPKTKEDAAFIKKLAQKMGMAVKVVKAGKKEAVKNRLITDLQEAIEEVKMIRSGKAKGLTPEEVHNALK